MGQGMNLVLENHIQNARRPQPLLTPQERAAIHAMDDLRSERLKARGAEASKQAASEALDFQKRRDAARGITDGNYDLARQHRDILLNSSNYVASYYGGGGRNWKSGKRGI
jgi:hypothetical protein